MEIHENRPAEYNGESPATAATKSFAWSFFGNMIGFSAVGLLFDRLFRKIPFGTDTWSRIKDDALISGTLAAGFGLWDANKTLKRVKEENHHAACNRLDIENTILRDQLKEAGLKPREIVSVRPVSAHELASMNLVDHNAPVAKQEDTLTELARTQQALTSASHALEVATNHAAGREAPPASHAARLGAPVESHVEQAVIDKAAAERTTATIH